MKISTHFDIRELVHPDIWAAHGERCADFINVNTAVTLETLKRLLSAKIDNTESVTINNWLYGGSFVNSGIRYNFGAERSTHRFGCGFDLKFKHTAIIDAYHFIIEHQDLFPYVSRIEHIDATPTWLHLEICTEPRKGNIYVFKP